MYDGGIIDVNVEDAIVEWHIDISPNHSTFLRQRRVPVDGVIEACKDVDLQSSKSSRLRPVASI
jgi:hypothetical protein